MTGPADDEGHELVIERTFAAPRDTVWRAMVDHFAEWWCPQPWTTEVVALDWRAGGPFSVILRGPEGEAHPVVGVLLDHVPGERFVFTNMLDAAWTPQVPQPVGIVGTFELADAGDGRTRYRASAAHWSAADRDAHDQMGFAAGWGACADQLEAVAKRLAENDDA